MCRENHFTKCIYPFPAPELHIFAIVKPLTWSEKGKHWCCCACTHHSSYIVFFDTCSPCSSYILKSIRIGALFVNCPDDNQQIILLSYYFSKSFVLVSRWTPQGCILSGLIVLVSDCTTDLHCVFFIACDLSLSPCSKNLAFDEDFYNLVTCGSRWKEFFLLKTKVSLLWSLWTWCGQAVTKHFSINILRTCVYIWSHQLNDHRIQNILGRSPLWNVVRNIFSIFLHLFRFIRQLAALWKQLH